MYLNEEKVGVSLEDRPFLWASEVTEESQLLKATQAVGTLQPQMSNEETTPRPSLWSSL